MAPTMARFNRRRPGVTWVVGLLTIGVIFSACGNDVGNDKGVSLQEDAQLLTRAQQVIRDGDSVPLREIAGDDWDRVHLFPGLSTREFVETTVDAPIDMPDIYNYDNGGIVVFVKGDTVQRVVTLRPYPFDGNAASYGPNVTAARPSPNASWLKLTDPPR